MGVLGLWKLLEPCGKPVPLERLEGKVVAVDVSIWLNQVIKGYRDGQNGALPNAHLMGVFHRVCKLLTYKIKPVFVFDGGVPALKRETLAARRLKKQTASRAADRSSQKLVQNLLRQEALRAVLGDAAPLPLSVGTVGPADPFQVAPPPGAPPGEESDSSSDSETDAIMDRLGQDMHSFDFDSEQFRNLAPQVKHDILSDLKDTRKQNSWGKIDQMPKDSGSFSDFQMDRLLKRKKFQVSMDEVEAEITKRNTELLHMGIDLPGTVTSQRMASRADTYLVLSQQTPQPQAQPKPKLEPQSEEEDDTGLLDAADTADDSQDSGCPDAQPHTAQAFSEMGPGGCTEPGVKTNGSSGDSRPEEEARGVPTAEGPDVEGDGSPERREDDAKKAQVGEEALWEDVDDGELREAAQELAVSQMELLEERGRQQRLAANVTDQMYVEIQTLLQLFGIPYVVSPKEAEAQCAFLEMAGLTEGTITDDSDIWLFGGNRVYKNFFNQNKFVELYQAEDIRGTLGMSRDKLVCVALLTGSDYTVGVESVGCVRALEVLAEFPGPGLAGLRAFRRWWEQCRAGDVAARTPIRRSLAALHLSQGFPSEAVLAAYLEPEVDTSREPFSWAPPDLDSLRHLASAKFGWDGRHTDTILTPMMQRYQQSQGQRRLDAYFSAEPQREVPSDASRRLQRAVRRVKGEVSPPPSPPPSPPARATPEPADDDVLLMDDGMDEVLLASLDALDGPEGVPCAEPAPAPAVDREEACPDEARPSSSSRPAGRGAAKKRPVRGGRGRGQRRARRPTVDANGCSPSPSLAAAVAGPSARPTPSPARSAAPAVNSDLTDLEPEARERVLLVRRMRERASLVRAQLRQEQPAVQPAAPRPTTREVRARMLGALLRHNPRLRLEREAQLRRRMGLPSSDSA
ncbi:DNA repair protein complementing XP-G cells homolog [Pollicipes pollicipes]|uniref:DNA repair protein complementing XP-G cells homolog n=1 Tax=Pollicipes pollicipes TaxID=41117 RepID=UPI00188565C7|nr:DNA repair protein complementing XP-G cells homolog [Pollicipes pollicipes]